MKKKYDSDIIIDLIENKKLEVDDFIVKEDDSSVKSKHYIVENFKINNQKQSKEIERPIGEYSLISIEDIRYVSDKIKKQYINVISEKLLCLLPTIKCSDEIIIVGLGNQNIESDSLGHNVANKIIVTRYLDYKKNNWPKISSITPSVMGITGIESADIIESIVNKISPKCIIVIDSLCASSPKRLGTSIQLTNAGIIPGGGILKPKKALNKETIGCEVISIGIPLMIFAKSFCESINDIDNNLIVTFHDIGEMVNLLGDIISKAINKSLIGIEKL